MALPHAESQISRRRGVFARVIQLDRSGTEESPITYRAYQNERPVFDFQDVKPTNQRVTAFLRQRLMAAYRRAGSDWRSSHDAATYPIHLFRKPREPQRVSRLSMHDGQAIGIYHVRGRDNLFVHCDAWNNWDRTSEDGRGGNVDGFGCHPTRAALATGFAAVELGTTAMMVSIASALGKQSALRTVGHSKMAYLSTQAARRWQRIQNRRLRCESRHSDSRSRAPSPSSPVHRRVQPGQRLLRQSSSRRQ